MPDFRARIHIRAERRIRFLETLLALLFLSWPAFPQETSHYSRIRDAKWYARQLQSLREEVAKIDTDVRSLVEARKSGKGITDAVEEQARHNAIVPGELRTEYSPEEPATPTKGRLNREAKDLENLLAQEEEHLDHDRKEVELLQRNQKLKAQQEYSNPEPPSRRSKPSEIVAISMRLTEKQAEVQDAEQRVADIEDRLEDLRRISAAESQTETDAVAGKSANDSENGHDEKDEAFWRKQFAAIDYKITTAQTELDILQRELNLGLVQYDPNPATAMKESVTRKEINEHRKAIEDKKKEIVELKKQRDDLEDALRHAGGPAGWARK